MFRVVPARWWTDDVRAAVKQFEAHAAAHEARHRQVAHQQLAGVTEAMAAQKTEALADALLRARICQMTRAQEDLDRTEGAAAFVTDPNGKVRFEVRGFEHHYPCDSP